MPAMRALDERLGVSPGARKLMRYVFPDHWSFMLGEIALYSFVILVLTGIFLTFFYTASDATVVYRGGYDPLVGASMGEQFRSVLHISFDVPAGLLMRQTHHWAADVFIVAIVLHALRILLTGAYRKPRELNYWVGVTMVGLALLEGFLGYSLADDLLSGMGLVIAYSVALAIPFVGDDLTYLIWGGEYPGTTAFWARLEIAHVLIIPVVIAGLIGLHLVQIMRQHHTQFAGGGGSEKQVVGTPTWPGYALRSLALFAIVSGLLFLLGGLVQINPIWEWGPYETWLSTNGAQPDWYLGWLIGGLRLMPPLELQAGGYTNVPTPFWGGLLFPTIVFGILYAWPAIGRRFFDGPGKHNLLDRPRDNPARTAAVLAFTAWVFTIFAAGAADRLYFVSWIPYPAQVWFFRGAAFILPVLVYFIARRIARELKARGDHPLRGTTAVVTSRNPRGGFDRVRASPVDKR
jgi:ubiquinol-cytochrome c reductase cytochrome b subunit